jgi:succinyl-diaminopimelate desuccinylase
VIIGLVVPRYGAHMANPLTPDVLVDPVVLSRALVDVESVSRDEKAIADCVEDVLHKASHLSVRRVGNTVMARTRLGREQRVILAGHLDTVPVNGNLPSTVVDDLIYGCGTADMKGGVALALHLAVTLPDPRYDVTYLFYESEEIESEFNGLNLVAREHPKWLRADFAVLLEPTFGAVEAGAHRPVLAWCQRDPRGR